MPYNKQEAQHRISRADGSVRTHGGVELDPIREQEWVKQAFAHYIPLHKQLRPLLHSGISIRLDHPDRSTLINAVIDEQQQQAVILVSQLALTEYALSGNMMLPGLEPAKLYRVHVLDMPENLKKHGAIQ